MVRKPVEPHAARLEHACSTLRLHGLPVTLQRRALLAHFVGRTDHPSVDMLHAGLARTLPGVNRATVYRTLETLVELGLATRMAHQGAQGRYDPHVERHHHLICEQCGAVEDVHSPTLDDLRLPAPASGFRARDYSVQFRGRCGACIAGGTAGAARKLRRKLRRKLQGRRSASRLRRPLRLPPKSD
jgi:Fur family peroxide stress response transcriptional regulator